MVQIARKRHIFKSLTWRVVGSLDTILISWLVSDDLELGLSIGFFEFISKFLLYYFHERLWYKLPIFEGRSAIRHVLKTVTWRFIGTIDTVIVGWVISGNATTGLTIGGFELFTKMLLYYLHERVWYKSNYGLTRDN